MRAVALGRKNHLLVVSEAGGKAAAIAYSLIETAKLTAIDPNAWLVDTLARFPDYKITKFDDLPPWRWKRLRLRLRLRSERMVTTQVAARQNPPGGRPVTY